MHIIFSGMDGSGKSTQIKLLVDYYNNKKIRLLWARGGYTPSFKFFKKIIKFFMSFFSSEPSKERYQFRSENNDSLRKGLFANNLFVRIWLLISIIDLGIYLIIYLRYLKLRGFIIINDRCHIDTEIDFLLRFPLHFNANGLLWRSIVAMVPCPDIAFICMVDPEMSITRSLIKKDLYSDPIEHLADRYSLYTSLPSKTNWYWCKLDCTKTIGEVHTQITSQLSKIYENRTT